MNPIARIRTRVFHMSQREFAAIVGVTQGTISRWEKGALEPSISQLSRIRIAALERDLPLSDAWFFEPALKPIAEASA